MMEREIHAPPGRGTDILALPLEWGLEAPDVVAKGEAVMAAMVRDRCSRQRECRGRGVGGGGGLLSWNGNA
jgi:hypothetical protein